MRREILYLRDIVEAADAISRFIAGTQKQDFVTNELVRSAVQYQLTIIGEATACLRKSLESRYPQIPWRDVVRFRNIAVHAYFGIDWDLVWELATKHAPALKNDVEAILASDYPDPPAS